MNPENRAAHTPGPWTYDGDNIDGRIGVVAHDVAGAPMVCDTWAGRHYKTHDPDCHHISDDEEEANARLIAAAPELLEALNELLEQIHYIGIADWHGAEGLSLAEARAAIAKATEGAA